VDKSTVFGLAGAFALVLSAIIFQGELGLFLSFSSFLIVGGGVVMVTVVNYSFQDLKNTFASLLDNLKNSEMDLRTDIELINMFSRKARREGLLAMEQDIQLIDDPFLKNGMMYLLDGI